MASLNVDETARVIVSSTYYVLLDAEWEEISDGRLKPHEVQVVVRSHQEQWETNEPIADQRSGLVLEVTRENHGQFKDMDARAAFAIVQEDGRHAQPYTEARYLFGRPLWATLTFLAEDGRGRLRTFEVFWISKTTFTLDFGTDNERWFGSPRLAELICAWAPQHSFRTWAVSDPEIYAVLEPNTPLPFPSPGDETERSP